MKSNIISGKFIVLFVLIFSSCQQKPVTQPDQKTDVKEFMGMWTLAIDGGSVGWLQVKQEDGYLDANLLWQGGSVLPVPYVYIAGNILYVGHGSRDVKRERKYDGNESSVMNYPDWLEIRMNGDEMKGYDFRAKIDGSGLDSTSFTGSKLPPVPPAPDLSSLKFGKSITLFNGKDLTGWEKVNPKGENPFHVDDGILVKDPKQVEGQPRIYYSDIRTKQVFKDFNLKIDVKVPHESNSGIYLRGMYEVQVEQGHADSEGKDLDSHNMAGIYSRISPTVNAEKPANTWQTLDITLCKRHVTVILNGTKIIDNQPLDGPTGGAIISDVFAPGPIMLQGGEHGSVEYRNIVLTPIED